MKFLLTAASTTLLLAGCSSQSRQPTSTNAPYRETQASPASRTGLEVDPVCGLEVPSQASPRETVGGRTFYFCSECCEDEFKKHPEAYLHPAPPDAVPKVR